MNAVSANLETVREKIAHAAALSGRSSANVTLVAVTKTFPVERIREAIEAGLTHFGENRVQEALAKYAHRGEIPGDGRIKRNGLTLHMIGTLQRNKAHRAAALFDYVHSLDRPNLIDTLNSAAGDRESASEPLPVLIEVNLTGEPSKSGCDPDRVPWLAEALTTYKHLCGVGLMTIARMGAPELELRRTFATLRAMLDSLRDTYPGNWTHLSMGMSDDYEYAIEEGATMVRLGRAIFGPRE